MLWDTGKRTSMPSTGPVLALLTLALSLGCAGSNADDAAGAGGGGALGDGRLFVPEGLRNEETIGQEGGLTLVAFTLERRERSLEAYAAIKNESMEPACFPGMQIDCLDASSELVTTVGATVEARFYLVDDGSGAVVPCIPPGEIGMAAATGFPPDLTLDHFASLEHRFPANLVPSVVPLDGVGVGKLQAVAAGEAVTYQGTLTNGLGAPVSLAKVTVFPVNRVGRPLGAGRISADMDVAAGASWPFETSSVPDRGTGYEAFVGGSVTITP